MKIRIGVTVALDRPATKTCARCGVEKLLDDFHRDRSAKDGRRPICATCAREALDRWRDAGGDAKNREYMRRKHTEERRELKWYRDNYPVEGKPWNE